MKGELKKNIRAYILWGIGLIIIGITIIDMIVYRKDMGGIGYWIRYCMPMINIFIGIIIGGISKKNRFWIFAPIMYLLNYCFFAFQGGHSIIIYMYCIIYAIEAGYYYYITALFKGKMKVKKILSKRV